MAFCDFVRKLREQNQLTQAQMAEILDVNVNTIKQIEANKIKTPSSRVLDRFCNYLNEDRLTVITRILFKKNEEVLSNDEYQIKQANVLSRYMSYLYLEGWNIDEAPVTYHTKDLGDLLYAGQLTKKREPNNKIVVTSISDTFGEKTKQVTNDEAVHFIASSLAELFCIDEVIIRGIHIVFDSSSLEHTKIFNTFKRLTLNKTRFNFKMILFDSKNGEVVDIISL